MLDRKRRTRQSKATFPFLQLPPELRVFVYECAILSPWAKPIDISTERPLPHSLTQVSQLVRAESIPVYLKKPFAIQLGGCDLSECDTWFEFFSGFDTSKVQLEVCWSWDKGGSTKAEFVHLLKKAFHGHSQIIPRGESRRWTSWNASLCAHFRRSGWVSEGIWDEVRVEEKTLDAIEAMGNQVIEAREQGQTWQQVEEELVEKFITQLAIDHETILVRDRCHQRAKCRTCGRLWRERRYQQEMFFGEAKEMTSDLEN